MVELIVKISISEKIKAMDNKIDFKISALPSGNVSKYELLTSKGVLLEKDLLEKASTMNRFEYFPLGKELRNQISVAKNSTKNSTMLLSLIK